MEDVQGKPHVAIRQFDTANGNTLIAACRFATTDEWTLTQSMWSTESRRFTPPPTPEEKEKTMTDIEFQKARITRASEQFRRACDRRDYETAQAWVRQFAIEVKRLNAIDPHGRTVQ